MADCCTMNITLCLTDTKPEPWQAGLSAAFPDARVSVWQAGAAPADYAVVWAPPQAFLDQQAGLRAIFNIGAGVDALMKSRLPAGVPVVRLDDAGMSVQMAEFVAHAMIRHFRELDGYEADVAQGKWSYRKPRLRSDFTVGVMGLGVLGQRVAQALCLFEFPVRGYSRSAKQVEGIECFSGPVGGAGFQAFLRGAHLVEADLLDALASGQVAGATLDVFRTGPLPAGHAFWQHPQITVTPHTSARTLREESIAQIAGKIRALQAGASLDAIAGVVNPERGY